MRLERKVAVVTGGGRSMGRGYCEGLAREGASVLVTDVDFEAAEAVAKGIVARGGTAAAARCDVADDDEVQAAAAAAAGRFGGIDILVNNAGLHLKKWTGPFSSKSPAEIRALFNVNVLGGKHSRQAACFSYA
jgi:3-oxoacyl-[acyl-carrier protein] reductase